MERVPAFGFLEPPARAVKPLRIGLTVASDKAISLADTGPLIETAGDIVDRNVDCSHFHAWRGRTAPRIPPP